MKRKISFLLALFMLLSFCGCSSDTVEETTEIIVQEAETTTSAPVSSSETSIPDTSVSDDSEESSKTDTPSQSPNIEDDTTTSTTPPTEQEDEGMYMLNDANVLSKIKLNGRCDVSADGISLGLAGSAIEFNTSASAVVLEADCTAGIYYTIMVDGVVTYERQVTETRINYIIVARNLTPGTHNIKLIRDCEGRTDMAFTAKSLQLDDGELLAKDADKPVIEFLGDSITSGYGNLIDNGVAEPHELKNQSTMKAYPYLVASNLGYDYRIISQSGIALTKREGYFAFPDYYKLENYHLDRQKPYTSSSPQDVDIVVVNLGTNDIASDLYDTTDSTQVEAFVKHYADLITNIGYSKDTKILFITDIWYHDPALTDGGVIKELNSRGYNNVYTLELNEYKSGGGSHPSGKEHKEIAQLILKFFKTKGIA